jgi:hypothetical protein
VVDHLGGSMLLLGVLLRCDGNSCSNESPSTRRGLAWGGRHEQLALGETPNVSEPCNRLPLRGSLCHP